MNMEVDWIHVIRLMVSVFWSYSRLWLSAGRQGQRERDGDRERKRKRRRRETERARGRRGGRRRGRGRGIESLRRWWEFNRITPRKGIGQWPKMCKKLSEAGPNWGVVWPSEPSPRSQKSVTGSGTGRRIFSWLILCLLQQREVSRLLGWVQMNHSSFQMLKVLNMLAGTWTSKKWAPSSLLLWRRTHHGAGACLVLPSLKSV